MQETIVNKVAESGIITLNLEDYYPKDPVVLFDLKDFLFMGLVLKEKNFREALLKTDWSQFQDKYVALTCSADAIIPVWAYMLVASYLQPFAKDAVFGDQKHLIDTVMLKNIASIDAATFTDKRVVIKGCGHIDIPETAYVDITARLKPYVKSIMYGEPCSTVPVYKRK